MPKEFQYVIDELLHNNYDIENKELYYERIIKTIVDIGRADEFIIAISKFIKTLAVDHLHIVGDIFDRGSEADKILQDLYYNDIIRTFGFFEENASDMKKEENILHTI